MLAGTDPSQEVPTLRLPRTKDYSPRLFIFGICVNILSMMFRFVNTPVTRTGNGGGWAISAVAIGWHHIWFKKEIKMSRKRLTTAKHPMIQAPTENGDQPFQISLIFSVVSFIASITYIIFNFSTHPGQESVKEELTDWEIWTDLISGLLTLFIQCIFPAWRTPTMREIAEAHWKAEAELDLHELLKETSGTRAVGLQPLMNQLNQLPEQFAASDLSNQLRETKTAIAEAKNRYQPLLVILHEIMSQGIVKLDLKSDPRGKKKAGTSKSIEGYRMAIEQYQKIRDPLAELNLRDEAKVWREEAKRTSDQSENYIVPKTVCNQLQQTLLKQLKEAVNKTAQSFALLLDQEPPSFDGLRQFNTGLEERQRADQAAYNTIIKRQVGGFRQQLSHLNARLTKIESTLIALETELTEEALGAFDSQVATFLNTAPETVLTGEAQRSSKKALQDLGYLNPEEFVSLFSRRVLIQTPSQQALEAAGILGGKSPGTGETVKDPLLLRGSSQAAGVGGQ